MSTTIKCSCRVLLFFFLFQLLATQFQESTFNILLLLLLLLSTGNKKRPKPVEFLILRHSQELAVISQNFIPCSKINRVQWEFTEIGLLADFVNCEHIIKAVFFAFLLNNPHISLVFPWTCCYFICRSRCTGNCF